MIDKHPANVQFLIILTGHIDIVAKLLYVLAYMSQDVPEYCDPPRVFRCVRFAEHFLSKHHFAVEAKTSPGPGTQTSSPVVNGKEVLPDNVEPILVEGHHIEPGPGAIPALSQRSNNTITVTDRLGFRQEQTMLTLGPSNLRQSIESEALFQRDLVVWRR